MDAGEQTAFYRRHAGRLLDELTERVGDTGLAAELCAEAFAVALLRSESELDGIAGALVERAGRRGCVEDRARRRLGMAPLEPGESFLRDLEEELVAAAAYLAQRRKPLRVPRPPAGAVRAVLAAAGALALAGAVAALAIGGGEGAAEPARADRGAAPEPGLVVPLVPMLARSDCGGMQPRAEPAAHLMPDFAVLTQRQHADDALMDEVEAVLPVGTFDGTETRLAGDRRLTTRLHVVPSQGVPDDASCISNGPGLCLVVERGGWYRCFRLADVRAGQALTRTPERMVVGIVPDGVGLVMLAAAGRTVTARVVDNVYEADLDVPPATRVRVGTASGDGCDRAVAPGLLERVATLRREPQPTVRLPQAGLDVLRGRPWQLDAVGERHARLWGGGDGLEVWAVPVVKGGSPECAPAGHLCVVAIAMEDGRADAQCTLGRPRGDEHWRLAPLTPGRAAIYGTVPDGVTGALVTVGQLSAEIDASDNVIGGMLPFPSEDLGDVRVELMRRPGPPWPVILPARGP